MAKFHGMHARARTTESRDKYTGLLLSYHRPFTNQARRSIGSRNVDVVKVLAAGALSRAADLASQLATAKTFNTSMTQIAATVTVPLAEHNNAGHSKTTTISTLQTPKDLLGAKTAAHHGEIGTRERGNTQARQLWYNRLQIIDE